MSLRGAARYVSSVTAVTVSELPAADERLVATTIAHYAEHAESYDTGTRTIDPTRWIDAFLGALPARGGLRLLDLGCGPGRDLQRLVELGHDAIGLDGAHAMAARARSRSGARVLEQNLLSLGLEADRFDGIFANASLFHVPRSHLTQVLNNLRMALVAGGVLFLRVPLGDDREERSSADRRTGRYACFLRAASWHRHLDEAGFEAMGPAPTAEVSWLEALFRRPAAGRLPPTDAVR